MKVLLKWNIWGLPFGFTKSNSNENFTYAFTVGPIHFVKQSKEPDNE